jgi:hypothetical protein
MLLLSYHFLLTGGKMGLKICFATSKNANLSTATEARKNKHRFGILRNFLM